MIGDQKQLPPTCMSQRAAEGGLSESIFDYLLRVTGMAPAMLSLQYRMHPLISLWPSQTFYDGCLLNGVAAEARPTVEGFPWPKERPMAFVEVDGEEEVPISGTSYFNREECRCVVGIVLQLLQTLDAEEIGVISPYRAQVLGIRKALREAVEVRSVDGYQGREKTVIIFSCVRSGASGNIGFLADFRRLNVALTRAKSGLIVVGNPKTLASHFLWRNWLEFMRHFELTLPFHTLTMRLLSGEEDRLRWIEGEIVQKLSTTVLVKIPILENPALPAAKGILKQSDAVPDEWQQLQLGSRVRVCVVGCDDQVSRLRLSMLAEPKKSVAAETRTEAEPWEVSSPGRAFEYLPTDRATADPRKSFKEVQRQRKKDLKAKKVWKQNLKGRGQSRGKRHR
eukprot:s538_g7.t1